MLPNDATGRVAQQTRRSHPTTHTRPTCAIRKQRYCWTACPHSRVNRPRPAQRGDHTRNTRTVNERLHGRWCDPDCTFQHQAFTGEFFKYAHPAIVQIGDGYVIVAGERWQLYRYDADHNIWFGAQPQDGDRR